MSHKTFYDVICKILKFTSQILFSVDYNVIKCIFCLIFFLHLLKGHTPTWLHKSYSNSNLSSWSVSYVLIDLMSFIHLISINASDAFYITNCFLCGKMHHASENSWTKRHNFHRLSNIVYNRYVQHNLAWIAFYRVSLYNPPLLPHAVLP